MRPRSPARLLLLAALLGVAGCGGGPEPAPPPGGPKPATGAAPPAPALRWDPEEHGPEAAIRSWALQEGWHADLEVLLQDEDPGGRRLAARVQQVPEPRRTELVGELLEFWERSGHPDLARLLRRFPRQLARVVAEMAGARPEPALRIAHRFFFQGPERVEAAWEVTALRNVVARLCERRDFDQTDIRAGEVRTWALRVAGKARLKEAAPAIMRAAGAGRDEQGKRNLPDPFHPAAAEARRIMRAELARRREAAAERR